MSTIRHFSGSREAGKHSVAREIMMIEMQKKGKLPPEMRYKLIFKRRMQETRDKAAKDYGNKQMANPSGSMVSQRKQSSRAQQALKEMAMKKAAKEAKKLRKMVIVQPQNFSNGSINKKGQIFDIAGNMIGQVNTKSGNMSAMNGWTIGKYKPKSYMTKLLIEQAINKYSPHFIKQRLLLAQQAAMSNVYGSHMDPNVMNVQGMSAANAMLGGGMYGHLGQHDHNVHGEDPHAVGSNLSVTAWGNTSNNAWGTFSNNVHGTTFDNVHGVMNMDVWGQANGGGGGVWGGRGPRMFGTGSGANHLSGITKRILALFGYQSKAAREGLRQARALRAAGLSASSMASAGPRQGGGGRR